MDLNTNFVIVLSILEIIEYANENTDNCGDRKQ